LPLLHRFLSQSRVKVAAAATTAAAPVLDLLQLGTATHRGRWDAPVGKAEEGCLQEDVRAGVKTKKGLLCKRDRRDQTFAEVKYER